MANQHSDGSIYIDVDIDSKGFVADSKELKKAVESLNNKINGLGPTFQKACEGNASALSAFKGKAQALEDTISDIENKMDDMANKQYDTTEYTAVKNEIEAQQKELDKLIVKQQELKASGKDTTLSDEYIWTQKALEKANAELERLQAKEDKMNATGVSPRSNQWKTLAYGMEQAQAKVQEYTNELERLEAAGNVTQEAVKWQEINNKIESAKSNLSELNSQKSAMENDGTATKSGAKTETYARMNQQLEEAKAKLSEMNSKAKSLNLSKAAKAASLLKSGLGKAASIAGGVLKKGIGAVVTGLKNAHSHSKSTQKSFLKMGAALLGMRGIMGGLKQIVSSALSNNEQLQSQLEAAKGKSGRCSCS